MPCCTRTVIVSLSLCPRIKHFCSTKQDTQTLNNDVLLVILNNKTYTRTEYFLEPYPQGGNMKHIRKCIGIVSILVLLSFVSAQRIPHYLTVTAPLLEPGVPYRSTLDEDDGQNFKDGSRLEVLQIFGFAGDVITLEVSSDFDSYLTVYDANNTLLASDDDSAGNMDAALTVTLPETRRYRVIVSGFSAFDLGEYTLTYNQIDTSDLRDGGRLTLPDSIQGFLDTSDDYDMDGARYFDSYELVIDTPQDITIDLFSTMFDTYLYIVDASDVIVAENDDGPISTDAQLVLSIEPGNYELIVTSFGTDATGLYRLEITLD